MNNQTQTIYQTLCAATDELSARSPKYGFYAQRKVAAVNPESPLEELLQVGSDIVLLDNLSKQAEYDTEQDMGAN